MIGQGMRVLFKPSFTITKFDSPEDAAVNRIVGTVTLVNWKHRMFTVEYECGDSIQRESFKFSQIGKDVTVCGRE
jgi:hypothetical protein